jgi:hypothetical protein
VTEGNRSSKTVVFDAGSSILLKKRLTTDISCLDLIDHVIEICLAGPEYLRPEDAHRHLSLLRQLKELIAVEASTWPSFHLGRILECWVKTHLYDANAHPLLASYALNTVELLKALICGYQSYKPDWWEIVGIVEEADALTMGLSFWPEREFKRQFTMQSFPLDVLASIPLGASVTSRKDLEVISPGSAFVFKIHRCHLSENTVDAYDVHLRCTEPNGPQFDLGREFSFSGGLFVLCRGSYGQYFCPSESEIAQNLASYPRDWEKEKDMEGVGMALPGRWITDALTDAGSNGVPQTVAVPEWRSKAH